MDERHVIICGGRDFKPTANDCAQIIWWLESIAPAVVHHGDAAGADRWAARAAGGIGGIRVVAHPADWNLEGRAAGPRRNARMLRDAIEEGSGSLPDLAAYPGGRGTADMVRRARAAGCRVLDPRGEPPFSEVVP